jgi:hypothetical protein
MQIFSRLPAFSLRVSAFAVVIALSACDFEGSSGTTAAAAADASVASSESSMSAVNIAPTITGTPATAVMIGAAYSFTPTAADVNSDTLTFSIQNKPDWATFNPATGQLVGTPDSAGLDANVLIAVSDGKTTTQLPAFAISVPALGGSSGSALVSWNLPTVNTDGSALTDLAGFHLYYGTDPAQLTRVDIQGASSVTYTASNLHAGTYYFTVASYNAAGRESSRPTVISTEIT